MVQTCRAIVNAVIGLGVEEEDRYVNAVGAQNVETTALGGSGCAKCAQILHGVSRSTVDRMIADQMIADRVETICQHSLSPPEQEADVDGRRAGGAGARQCRDCPCHSVSRPHRLPRQEVHLAVRAVRCSCRWCCHPYR